MSEFVKPKREIVVDPEYMNKLVEVQMVKDLHDDEEICPWCHGTGLEIVDNPYGLSDDPDRGFGNRFPYTHQSVQFCRHCYNGVVHRCKLCGEIMPKGRLKHDCEAQRRLDAEVANAKELLKFVNASVMSDEDAAKLGCYQTDDFPYNDGYFFDWQEFFDAYADEHDISEVNERPQYVWATTCEKFRINARDMVENQTEDLYEDAFEKISEKDISDLQEYLNEWCKNCGVGNTYYIDYKHKVRIPWEEYK